MKNNTLAIMFLVGCSSGSGDDRYHDSQSQSITFGFPVNIATAPYMVSLRDTNGDHHCGGSVLSSTKILTASHCISSRFGRVILAGFTQQSQTAQAQRREVAPGGINRIAESETGDITVLTLSEPLNFNANLQPIRIVSPLDTGFPAVGQETFVAGWGAIDIALAPRLQETRDRIVLRKDALRETQKQINEIEVDIEYEIFEIAEEAEDIAFDVEAIEKAIEEEAEAIADGDEASFTPQEIAERQAKIAERQAKIAERQAKIPKRQAALKTERKIEAKITQEIKELEETLKKTRDQLAVVGITDIVGGAAAGSGDVSTIGLTSGLGPDHLQGVYVKLVEVTDGDLFIFAKAVSDATRRSACFGDSGGPLVFQTTQGPVQIGVVSFTGDFDCGTSDFTFGGNGYSNVKIFHKDIIAELNRGNE